MANAHNYCIISNNNVKWLTKMIQIEHTETAPDNRVKGQIITLLSQSFSYHHSFLNGLKNRVPLFEDVCEGRMLCCCFSIGGDDQTRFDACS